MCKGLKRYSIRKAVRHYSLTSRDRMTKLDRRLKRRVMTGY